MKQEPHIDVPIRPSFLNFQSSVAKVVAPAAAKTGAVAGKSFDAGLTKTTSGTGKKVGDQFTTGVTKGTKGTGKEVGEQFTRDVNGKLRDSRGKFVGEGKHAGTALSKGFKLGVAGIAAAVIGVFAVSQPAIAFEKQISGIGAVSGATTQELAALRKEALQLGADTAFSATESAAAMEELAKAGLSIPQILGGAADATVALAAAGGVALPEAATIASDAMNSFKLTAADLPTVADLIAGAANASSISVSDFGFSLSQVGAIAKIVGGSFSDTATAIALMGQQGIKGSDAGTSLKTMLLNLNPKTDKAKSLMESLGIVTADGANRFFDATGKLKGLADIAGILQGALKGMTEQQRLATLEQLFGQDAIRAGAILTDAGAAGFNEMATAMGKVKAADVAAARLDNAAGAIEQFKGSAETAAISLGYAFLPLIKRGALFLGDAADRLIEFGDGLQGIAGGGALNTIGLGLRAVATTTASVVGWFNEHRAVTVGLVVVLGTLVAITAAHAIALGISSGALVAWLATTKVVTVATRAWAAVQWLMNAALLANPIVLIIVGLIALGAALVIAYKKSETFRAIVTAAWTGIKIAAVWVWQNFLRPIFRAFVWQLQALWLVVKIVFAAIKWYVMNVLAPPFLWLWRTIIKPVFAIAAAFITAIWKRDIKPVFTALGDFIVKSVAPRVKKGIDAIGRFWNGLKKLAAAPINWVITWVVNKGIVDTLNKVKKMLGVGGDPLSRVPTIGTGGSSGPASVGSGPGVFAADGAVLPGYRPGVDTIPAVLSPGEGILRPEVVRALGRDQIYRWNRQAKSGQPIEMFADGGIAGLMSGPAKWLADRAGISRIAEKFRDSTLLQAATALPRKLLGYAVEKVKGWLSAGGSGGSRYLGKDPTGSVGAILAMARRFYPGARVSSGYRRTNDYHGRGLAADLIGGGAPGMARMARGFYGMSSRLLELIHTPTSTFVKHGRRVGPGYYASVLGQHYNHVHVAARRDALFGSFDQGGMLPPGYNAVYNGTRRPEAVLTDQQWQTVRQAARGGDGVTYQINARTADITVRDLEVLQRQQEARQRVGRPR